MKLLTHDPSLDTLHIDPIPDDDWTVDVSVDKAQWGVSSLRLVFPAFIMKKGITKMIHASQQRMIEDES